MLLLIKNCLTNYVPKLVTYKPVAYKKKIVSIRKRSNTSFTLKIKYAVSTTKHTSSLCKNFFTTFPLGLRIKVSK